MFWGNLIVGLLRIMEFSGKAAFFLEGIFMEFNYDVGGLKKMGLFFFFSCFLAMLCCFTRTLFTIVLFFTLKAYANCIIPLEEDGTQKKLTPFL